MNGQDKSDAELPLDTSGNRPKVAARSKLGEVIGTGTIVLEATESAFVEIDDLVFEVNFRNDKESKPSTDISQPNNKSLKITCINFKSPFGVSVIVRDIGIVNGRKLSVSLFVETVDKNKILTYTFYWGRDDG